MKEKIKNKYYKVLGIITATLLLSPVGVYADAIGDAANKAESGIIGTLQSLVKPVLAIVVGVAGVILLVKGQRGKEDVKESIPAKVVGVVLVLFASGIAVTTTGWFN